jgi:hypothetical protein
MVAPLVEVTFTELRSDMDVPQAALRGSTISSPLLMESSP